MKPSYTMDDFRAELRRRGVPPETGPTPEPRQRADKKTAAAHGATIIKIVPCGVHPLHLVKVRASGARSGCPMCEMQIEAMCRTHAATPTPRDHAPRITRDRTRIVGCACGWRTPAGTDSDDAYVAHVTVPR